MALEIGKTIRELQAKQTAFEVLLAVSDLKETLSTGNSRLKRM
jgi:hypothetical protein